MPGQTPSQTVGPFFAYGLVPEPYGRPGIAGARIADADVPGERIRVRGRVFDGAGAPVPDALIEVWQADAAGRYAMPEGQRAGGFRGFGRMATGPDGSFAFETVKPGRVPGRGNTLQAPHLTVLLFARGVQHYLATRLYFADEERANAEDSVLAAVDPMRRGTLVARREESPEGPTYVLDLHLQGDSETVFFDL